MRKLLKDCIFIMFVVVVMFFMTSQPSFSGTMKFAQLSDIHYSVGREDTSYKLLSHTKELLEDAVNQINKHKNLKFVIVTGDGIDAPDKRALDGMIEGLNGLNYPWYISVGNHDTAPSSYINKLNFFKEIRAKNKKFTFTSTYYTFKPQRGFRVIVMDGASNEGRSPHGAYSEEELQWLDTILSESQNDVVLIFQHFPIVTPYDSKSHEIRNADEYSEILKKYKMPIALFSGHYHAAKITKEANILHVSTPALVSYPNSFRVVEVKNTPKKAIFKFEFCETSLKDLQQTAKIRIVGDSIFYGKQKDRETEITIEKK